MRFNDRLPVQSEAKVVGFGWQPTSSIHRQVLLNRCVVVSDRCSVLPLLGETHSGCLPYPTTGRLMGAAAVSKIDRHENKATDSRRLFRLHQRPQPSLQRLASKATTNQADFRWLAFASPSRMDGNEPVVGHILNDNSMDEVDDMAHYCPVK